MNRRTFLQFVGVGFVGFVADVGLPPLPLPVRRALPGTAAFVFDLAFDVPPEVAPTVYVFTVGGREVLRAGLAPGTFFRWLAPQGEEIVVPVGERIECTAPFDTWSVLYHAGGEVFSQRAGEAPVALDQLPLEAADVR